MHGPRAIEIELGASEDAPTTFARDQLACLRTADDGLARARIWRRDATGLLAGRFHRLDPEAMSISRRLSGGRIVPVGPEVVCITLVVPVVDWLDPGSAPLRPDQVLNRAVRPLLAMLRESGIASVYPGRDLVTADRRTIAHLSFTVMRDGVGVVEMHVAERPAFASLAQLLERADPAGIAGVDKHALAGATSLEQEGVAPRSDDEWAALLAKHAAASFHCELHDAWQPGSGASLAAGEAAGEAAASATAKTSAAAPAPIAGAAAVHAAAHDADERTLADEAAERDFRRRPGPPDGGALVAAAVSMLGVVECSAALRGDRITRLAITGDVIAPFHTLDDIAAECEGEPLRPANVRKALARALARPRSFLLGLRELDELILRLA